jgi:hypothetical protein
MSSPPPAPARSIARTGDGAASQSGVFAIRAATMRSVQKPAAERAKYLTLGATCEFSIRIGAGERRTLHVAV